MTQPLKRQIPAETLFQQTGTGLTARSHLRFGPVSLAAQMPAGLRLKRTTTFDAPVGLRIKAEGRSQWPHAALERRFTTAAFLCARGASALSHVVAAIAIPGLPSREDHPRIRSALAAYLGLRVVAPMREASRAG